MRKVILLLFLMVTLLGVIPPGLGVIFFFFAPFMAALWIALEVARYGRPGEAVLHASYGQLLGPGGPDDPFADEDVDVDEPRVLAGG
jgi:hypothetical protein